MKFHKVILFFALTALIIIFDSAESQIFPPPPTHFPTPPPPPPPPPPKTTPTPPPPPPPKSTSTTPTNTTTDPLFPPPSSSLPPSLPPPSSSIPLSPSSSIPLSPTSSLPNPNPPPTSSKPQTPSSPAASPQFDCSVLLQCSDSKMYCDIPAGKCRSKKNLGDQCNNDGECSSPLVCRENTCGYSDVETANRNKNGNDNYNVKKIAIFGAIVVGASGICGLVFFVIRYLKKKRDYDIASRLYSTDDDMSDADPYPFAERSNSFSKNTSQPPRAPTTNRYDNLPPTGNRAFAPRPGYQNYYNKYNEGMYMRQNIPNEETRTMNLLQQTRGNVMVTPQQNYNWNMRMNQGGLFPIPTVNVVPPNNMNNVVLPPPNNIKSVPSPKNVNNVAKNMNNTRKINNINSPGEDDDSKNDHVAKTLRYSVDYTNDQNNHQTNHPKVVRRDSNTLSSDDVSKVLKEKNSTQSTYNPSILDSYTRESIFTKTLETKLSKSSMKFNNNADDSNTHTIQQNISRA